MTTHPTTELDALRVRVRQLHADTWAWVAAPTTRAAVPLLIEALTLCMDLTARAIETDAENRALRTELSQAREALELVVAGVEQHERLRNDRGLDD